MIKLIVDDTLKDFEQVENEKIKKILNIILECQKQKFYGDLTIKFEGGKIILIKKNQSIKL